MRMKTIKALAIAAVLFMAVSMVPALAQASRDLNFVVTLAEWYDLYIGQNTITFTDVAPAIQQNPPSVQIPANENPVDVRAFAILIPSSSLTLTVTAQTDFDATIPASTVSWTVTGAGYQAGSLQAGTPVTVGSWSGAAFHWHEGTMSFSFLRDYLTQAPGTYSLIATYTLSKV